MVSIFVYPNKFIRACTTRQYTPSMSCYFYKNNPAPLYSMRREALLVASRGDDEHTCSETSSQLEACCIGPTTRVDERADSVRVCVHIILTSPRLSSPPTRWRTSAHLQIWGRIAWARQRQGGRARSRQLQRHQLPAMVLTLNRIRITHQQGLACPWLQTTLIAART
jgi:hypothetical protein